MQANKVREQQTILDMAAQFCGQADSLFDVAAANNMGITDELVPGQQVSGPDPVVTDVAAWFSKYGVYPASAVNSPALVLPGGIGYMEIGFDFKVS